MSNEVNYLFPSKANAQVEALECRLELMQQEVHIMRYVLARCVMECQGDIARLANDALNFRAKNEHAGSR
jgi:hypothetical protein